MARTRTNEVGGRMTQGKIKAMNQYRESQDLPPLKLKHRKCLKCAAEFLSDGPGNRLCQQCSYRYQED